MVDRIDLIPKAIGKPFGRHHEVDCHRDVIELAPERTANVKRGRFSRIRNQNCHVEVAIRLSLAKRPRANEDYPLGIGNLDGSLDGAIDLLLRRSKLFESGADFFGGQHGGLKDSLDPFGLNPLKRIVLDWICGGVNVGESRLVLSHPALSVNSIPRR